MLTLDQVNDFVPSASPEDFKGFLKSKIHIDYQTELDIRIEDLRNLLEIPDHVLKDKGDESHDMIRGAIKFARQMKDLFNTLLLGAEEALQTKEIEEAIQENENGS